MKIKTILLVTASILGGVALPQGAYPASKTIEDTRIVAPTDRASPYHYYSSFTAFGEWPLNEDWGLVGNIQCPRVADQWGWWPVEEKCYATLSMEFNQNGRNGEYVLARALVASREMRSLAPVFDLVGQTNSVNEVDERAPENRTLVVAQLPTTRYDVDRVLLGQEQLGVVIKKEHKFELLEYAQRSQASLLKWQKLRDGAVQEARARVIGDILSWLALLAAAGFALRWVIRRMPKFGSRAKSLARDTIREAQKIRVRHVVQDELIRQTTRDMANDLNEEQKAALRNQIHQALERGDYGLAENLSAIMKKLTIGQSDAVVTLDTVAAKQGGST